MGSAGGGAGLLWQVRIAHAGHLSDLLSPAIVLLRPSETLDAACRRLIAADKLLGRVVEEVQVRPPLPTGGSGGATNCLA